MEWTHTSANLQHAKTTARREQSRESDAKENTVRMEEMLWRVRPFPPSKVTAPHIRVNIHHEAHARPRCRRGHRARARASEAAGLTRSPPPPRLPRSACHQPRGRSKGSAQRIGARREGRGALACAPFIHPLLRGDVNPVGGAAPVDRQEPRRPTCSGRLRSGAQHKVALDSAGLGRGSPAEDRLDLRWAVGCAQVVVALRRGGRLTTARHTAGTPPNTAQGGRGVQRARAGAAGAEQGAAGACQALTGETSPPRPPAHRHRGECSAGSHRSSGRRRRRRLWH